MCIDVTTDYPKALASINVGVRLDLANWVTALGEFAGDQFFRIVDSDNWQQSIDLEVGTGIIETWKRVPPQARLLIGPFDALSRARSVDCPTLIVSGSEDILTRPWMANELTKAMGRHARQVSLSGVGHNNMLNSGGRLWNVVKDFLKSPERIGP